MNMDNLLIYFLVMFHLSVFLGFCLYEYKNNIKDNYIRLVNMIKENTNKYSYLPINENEEKPNPEKGDFVLV